MKCSNIRIVEESQKKTKRKAMRKYLRNLRETVKDREAWGAAVHRGEKSQTGFSD